MVCSCCGQIIKENKVHKEERPEQENIIGKWLSNDKIDWEYSTGYMKSVSWKYPLRNAHKELNIGSFYFEIHCWVDTHNNINGRIQIRIPINGRKKRIDVISLNGMNDITTDKVCNMIQDWIINYKNLLCDTCNELKEVI